MENDTMSTNIIGISGKARSGKDTIADYLIKNYGYTKLAYADLLKNITMLAFGFTKEQLYGDQKFVVDEYWGNTPAYYLQILGTECFRERIDNDFWVKAAMKIVNHYPENLWVIPDVRFPNEVTPIQDRGGMVIRINRKNRPPTGRDDNHPSEIALDDYEGFDYVIDNDGTIEELYNKLEGILENRND